MFEYRISKYNPKYRINGKYTRNEWSSVADIGKKFSDGILSEQECCDTIDRYCECVKDVLQSIGVNHLIISDLEKYEQYIKWKNGQIISLDEVSSVVRECLWENCWCRLSGEAAFIHFGYELYMYLGCALQTDQLSLICDRHRMFYEIRNSPYKDEE